MIDFLNYHKAYGPNTVLSVPELIIPAGIHWIKGMNGSGKSTLLKSIAGIIPFDGEILVNRYSLTRKPVESRRHVSYCEAEPTYPEFLTAAEIIEFVARTRNIENKDVEEIIRYFQVDTYKKQATGGYSAGMLKKLSLCIAFIGKVTWILLDEPFAFIDEFTERKLVTLINRKRADGVNMIITSHHELDQEVLVFDGIYTIESTKLLKIR